MSRFLVAIIFALTVVGAIAVSPGTAQAFCCPSVKTIYLTPLTSLPLRGMVEINECEGMSFLHIVLRGNIPDGSQFVPGFPGAQPLLGNWITMKSQKGDSVWEGVTTYGVLNGGLTGRTLVIFDQNFTAVAQGTF